jgi:hypothetical protein
MIGYYGLQNNEWLKGLFDEQYDKALRDKMGYLFLVLFVPDFVTGFLYFL